MMNGRPIPETIDPRMMVKKLIFEIAGIPMCEYGCTAENGSTES